MSDESQVKQLEAQLHRLGLNDPAKLLSCCERILAVSAQHPLALHCKALAQMHLNKHAQALETLEQVKKVRGGKMDGELAFHTACTTYRLGNFTEAVAILNAQKAPLSLGARHLLAQAYYNLEEFQKCVDIYETMLQNDEFRDDQDRQEVITNLSAAQAGYNAAQVAQTVQEAEEKTFDILYNAATAKIEMKELDAADTLLVAAENMARAEHELPTGSQASTEAELDNKEYFNEVAPILVQRAYILHVKGQEVEAEKLLKIVLDRKPKSISTYAVACVNWAALKRHRDFFETHRRLKHAQSAQVQAKLTQTQKLFVLYNTALLLLHSGKLQQCKATVDRIIRDSPDSPLGPLAMVALLLKEKGTGKAEAYLKQYLQKRSDVAGDDAHAELLVAQLWVEQGNWPVALKHLAEIKSLTESNPAAIATLADGYADIGEVQLARDVLQKAIDKKIPGAAEYAADFFLQHSLFDEAAQAYKLLLKNGSGASREDTLRLEAGLAAALTATDAEEAFSVAVDKLLSPSELSQARASNSAELERQQLPKQILKEKGFERKSDAAEINAAKGPKKRVRPMRRPPAVKPSGPPDPERWVPMSLRPSIQDLPARRIREMKRMRANEQEQKRKQHLKKKAAAEGEQSA